MIPVQEPAFRLMSAALVKYLADGCIIEEGPRTVEALFVNGVQSVALIVVSATNATTSSLLGLFQKSHPLVGPWETDREGQSPSLGAFDGKFTAVSPDNPANDQQSQA